MFYSVYRYWKHSLKFKTLLKKFQTVNRESYVKFEGPPYIGLIFNNFVNSYLIN